jgi:hypothetical protein
VNRFINRDEKDFGIGRKIIEREMFNPQTEGGTAPIYFMNAPQMTNQALQYLQGNFI